MAFHRYSLVFNTSWVDFGDQAAFKIATKTWGFWLKSWDTLFAGPGWFLGANATHYGMAADARRLRLSWDNAALAAQNLYGATGGIVYNKWNLVAFRQSVSGNDVVSAILVNGRVIASSTRNDGYSGVYGTTWRFGAYGAGSFVPMALSGAFLTARAMTNAELVNVWSYQTAPEDIPNLVAFWPMTEGYGTTITSVGTTIVGTLGGTANPVWRPDVPTRGRLA